MTNTSIKVPKNMKLEKGLFYWMAKQQRLWRQGKLEKSKISLFNKLGINLNIFNNDEEWYEMAHLTCLYLTGSKIKNPEENMDGNKEIFGIRNFKHDYYVMPDEVADVQPTGDVIEKNNIEIYERFIFNLIFV